jgi:hypothetical protein
MGWDEAARLTEILRADPSSALASALEGWEFPISREALAIYDLFDATVMLSSDPKGPRPKPHGGRPFKPPRTERQYGDATGLDPAEVKARLAAAAGRQAPV